MIRRYLVVVGIILVALVSIGLFTKPKPDDLREAVEESVAAYEKAQATSADVPDNKLAQLQTISEAHDYFVALSYSAKLANGVEVFCIGAFKVTYCQSPD